MPATFFDGAKRLICQGSLRLTMIIARAPSRAEWLGNHTDYNHGLVLGVGLEVGATVTARPAPDGQLALRAEDLGEEMTSGLDPLRPVGQGAWANYAFGLAAGVSSSAALECATARALQQARGADFNDKLIDEAERSGRLQSAPWRRARHIVGENARVATAVEALRAGDLSKVGQLMNESHESSRTLFENSCEELDFLAAEARTIPGCLGARLTGGGFGGAVLALVRRGTEEVFVKSIGERGSWAWGRTPQTLVTGAGGA